MDLGLRDRVYVVSGASRGLGRAGAEVLALEGARVVLSARDADGVTLAAADIGGSDRAVGVPANLADPGSAERVVAAAVARYGRLDGALISMGSPPAGGADDVTDDAWRAAFEAVFLGPLRLARAVAHAVGDEGGAIAIVLSTTVKSPLDNLATSNGLRPGLAMVAKQLADELGPRGVRVNGLLPGAFETGRHREPEASSGRGSVARRRREATVPLGRLGDPMEFARVAAFLLSPAASYVTGTMVAVDGGALRAL